MLNFSMLNNGMDWLRRYTLIRVLVLLVLGKYRALFSHSRLGVLPPRVKECVKILE